MAIDKDKETHLEICKFIRGDAKKIVSSDVGTSEISILGHPPPIGKIVTYNFLYALKSQTIVTYNFLRAPPPIIKVKGVGIRKFHLLSVNPLGKNVVSIAQNCSKTSHFCVREAGRFTVDRFIHFCARRCSETYILKFGNARRCSARHILLLADEPSR